MISAPTQESYPAAIEGEAMLLAASRPWVVAQQLQQLPEVCGSHIAPRGRLTGKQAMFTTPWHAQLTLSRCSVRL